VSFRVFEVERVLAVGVLLNVDVRSVEFFLIGGNIIKYKLIKI
jgi:hypothetical protein